jgi:hypothetical protein
MHPPANFGLPVMWAHHFPQERNRIDPTNSDPLVSAPRII